MVINFLSTIESSYPYIMAAYTQVTVNEEKRSPIAYIKSRRKGYSLQKHTLMLEVLQSDVSVLEMIG